MSHGTQTTPSVTIGLDLGDKFSQFFALAHDGEILEEGRVKTSRSALEKKFSGYKGTRIVMEVGTHSPWVSELLRECGLEVIVANPYEAAKLSRTNRKNDKVDAESLARFGRLDPKLLRPVHHRGRKFQKDELALEARDTLVKIRTLLINSTKGMVKSFGGRITGVSPDSFHNRAIEQIPEDLRPLLSNLLSVMAVVSAKVKEYDKKIESLAEKQYPVTEKFQAITGVGPVTSLDFALTIADPARFQESRDVGPFLGLVPRQYKSGDKDPQLRITKAGNKRLRRHLVCCAHHILQRGPSCDLKEHGLKIAARGGKNAKKRAVVAIARKLAVLLHRLWVSGDTYDPLYNAKKAAPAPSSPQA